MKRAVVLGLVAALAVGLLEAAWTGPGRGAPTNTWLGVLAILILLVAVTFPHIWLVPGLAILEEIIHGFVGYPGWAPTTETVFNHWSHAYVGFPLMPYLTFPLLTLAGFLAVRYLGRRAARRAGFWRALPWPRDGGFLDAFRVDEYEGLPIKRDDE